MKIRERFRRPRTSLCVAQPGISENCDVSFSISLAQQKCLIHNVFVKYAECATPLTKNITGIFTFA